MVVPSPHIEANTHALRGTIDAFNPPSTPILPRDPGRDSVGAPRPTLIRRFFAAAIGTLPCLPQKTGTGAETGPETGAETGVLRNALIGTVAPPGRSARNCERLRPSLLAL